MRFLLIVIAIGTRDPDEIAMTTISTHRTPDMPAGAIAAIRAENCHGVSHRAMPESRPSPPKYQQSVHRNPQSLWAICVGPRERGRNGQLPANSRTSGF